MKRPSILNPPWPQAAPGRILWHRWLNLRDYRREVGGWVWAWRFRKDWWPTCELCGAHHPVFTSRGICNHCRRAWPDAHKNAGPGFPSALAIAKGIENVCIDCRTGPGDPHRRGCSASN